MLVAFVYDFPHKKSYEGLLKLAITGNLPDLVVGAPFRNLGVASLPLQRIEPLGLKFEHPESVSRELGVPYISSAHNSTELKEILADMKPDIGVILGARILEKGIIDLFNIGILNMHPGCLPANRGLNNLKWAIIDDLPQGISTHFIDSRIDLGRLIEISIVPVFSDDHYLDIFLRIQNLELESLSRVLCNYKNGILESIELQHGKYNEKLAYENEKTMQAKFKQYKENYEKISYSFLKEYPNLPWVE
jgi:methionyl-tRNA formyltransferase